MKPVSCIPFLFYPKEKPQSAIFISSRYTAANLEREGCEECLEGEPAELICISPAPAWSAGVSARRRGLGGQGSDVFVPLLLGSSWSSQPPARF